MPKLHHTLFTTHTIPKIAQSGDPTDASRVPIPVACVDRAKTHRCHFKISLLFYNKTFLFISRIQQHGHALDLSSRKVFNLLLLHPSMTNKLKEAGGEANV